jgi:hypothetical protein
MRLSESPGPWTFTQIKVEPGSSRGECEFPRGHRRQGVQPVRPAALFGSLSESPFPEAAVRSTSRELAGNEAGFGKRIAANMRAKSMIMACRVSTKAGLDR